MAEAIGLTASVIGIGELAARVAKGILKLKAFWDDVKEAPDDIAYQLRELDILMSSLASIEDQNKRNELPPHVFDMTDMRRSFELCRDGTKELTELVDELSLKTATSSRLRRKIEAAKTVLKKDELQKIKTRLSSAISILRLAGQAYDRALSQVRFDIMLLQLSKIAPSSHVMNMPASMEAAAASRNALDVEYPLDSFQSFSKSPTHTNQRQGLQSKDETSRSIWVRGNKLLGTIEWETISTITVVTCNNRKDISRCNTTGQSTKVTIQPPTWLLNKAWQALYHNMVGQWTFSFRAYNIVSYDSPVMTCVMDRDLDGLKALFSSKQATPHDRDSSGNPLLFWSFIYGSSRTVPGDFELFLMEQSGAPEDQGLLVAAFMEYEKRPDLASYDNFCQRLFTHLFDCKEDYPDNYLGYEIIYGLHSNLTPKELSVITSHFLPNYFNMKQIYRVKQALCYLGLNDNPFKNPDTLWKMLSPENEALDSDILDILNIGDISIPYYSSILHEVAALFGEMMIFYDRIEEPIEYENVMPRFPEQITSPIFYHWNLRASRSLNLEPNQFMHPLDWIPVPFLRARYLKTPGMFEDWCVFMKHLVISGENLHLLANGWTPMIYAISRALLRYKLRISQYRPSYCYNKLEDCIVASTIAVRAWVQGLAVAGVDIQQYGEIEKNLHLSGKVSKDCALLDSEYGNVVSMDWHLHPEYANFEPMDWHLVGFEYGSSPDDWHIWIAEPTDIFAGEFWDMVEHPERAMPGAWFEEL